MQLKKINIFSIILILSGFILSIFAAYFQPLIGDDYHFKFSVNNTQTFSEYFNFIYFGWSGRFLQTLLSYLVFKYDFFLLAIKILNIPVFFTCILIGWYCVTGEKKIILQNFVIFALIIWLSISSVAENIIWILGSVTYLYPLLFSLIFLLFFFNCLYKLERNENICDKKIFEFPAIIILGFISGSSNEQISVITFLISLFLILKIRFKYKKYLLKLIIGFVFLIIGICYLFFAPGNFERLNVIDDPSIVKFYKYTIYLAGSYFSLGEETAGKLLFLSILVITLSFNNNFIFNRNIIFEKIYFFLGSFFSLLIMLPVASFVSTRTTFYAIFFFYLFWLSINYLDKEKKIEIYSIKKIIIVFMLSSIFFVDSLISSASNLSLMRESIQRFEIINKGINDNSKLIEVPFYSTIPSRLTYIQNPSHDVAFLEILSKEFKVRIVHDFNNNSKSIPFSKNILKIFKNFLD